MKFYIPTSSLNLDNILQSECILPITHYSYRRSGFKTFEQIDELRSFNGIVMFKYPVKFEIKDTGRYNFPILIEFEDDGQTCDFADSEFQNDVYLCNHRLNVTPLNCRFYFFSNEAYNLTLINTQSNKAVKYFKEYKIYPTATMLKMKDMPLLDSTTVELSKYEDTCLDKQKGLLFAYILGKKMSVNTDLAKQLRLTQELYNILTNIISSPSTMPIFQGRLATLLSDYKEIDSIEIDSYKRFNKQFDQALGTRFLFLKDTLIDFLKRISCWDLVYSSLCQKWNCNFLPDICNLVDESGFSWLRNEIEKRTSLALSVYSQTLTCGKLSNIYISGDTISISEAELVNVVINYIITNSIIPEDLLANRMDFYMNVMKDIVSLLKIKMGEENWAESEEKNYVNHLYAFIKDPSVSFSLNEISNVELKSIAAFILKGQSFKDCVTYMRINEFEDYRYVLSLWGCLCGYMEMNRDALSPVLSMDNYEKVYKKLFGSYLSIISDSNSEYMNEATEEFDSNLFYNLLVCFKYKDPSLLTERIATSVKNDVISLEETVECILSDKQFKRAKKQCDIARIALKIYQIRNEEQTLKKQIDKLKLSLSVQTKILTLLGFSSSKTKKGKKKPEIGNLFSETESQIEIQKTEGLPVLSCINGLNEKVIRRLEQNWKFTGDRHTNDMKERINHFVNLCKKEGREGNYHGPTSLTSVFTEELANQVEQELKFYYGIR